MTHRDGVYATRPLFDAGERPELTVSDPRPNAAKEAAVDVPDPFDEPEENAAVKYSKLYGLSARPCSPLCIPEAIIGGVFVRPTQTAPAPRSFSATKESLFATRSLNAGEPVAQVMPLYIILSLMVYGMPSSGPSTRPERRLSSLEAASSNASRFNIGIELRHGPLQS